jgi:hypothetical protein
MLKTTINIENHKTFEHNFIWMYTYIEMILFNAFTIISVLKVLLRLLTFLNIKLCFFLKYISRQGKLTGGKQSPPSS